MPGSIAIPTHKRRHSGRRLEAAVELARRVGRALSLRPDPIGPAPAVIDAGVVLAAFGDLTADARAAEVYRSACRTLRKVARPRWLRLDLQCVECADTKLVAYLVELHRLARQRNVVLDVRPSSCVRHLLEVCRLEHLLARA